MTACASEITKVCGNCFAQVRVAATRGMPEEVCALLCEHPGSESFPNIDRKLIDCGESWNERNTRAGAQRSEIKLRPCALIWNCSYASRDPGSLLE
jgi:hypothetical protein